MSWESRENVAMRRIDSYEVVCPLGQGAFGSVFEVRSPVAKERLALKLLKRTDPTVVERFLREAS